MLYERTCKLGGVNAAKGLANKLVAYPDWKDMVSMLGLADSDLSVRDVSLCFLWSRMRVVDEQDPKGRLRLMHLSFEDWLEALCRVATLKSLPTDEEIAEAEAPNAGVYMKELAEEEPAAYDQLMKSRAIAFGATPLQPIWRCIEHLIQIIIVHVQGDSRERGAPLVLTDRQVNAALQVPSGTD